MKKNPKKQKRVNLQNQQSSIMHPSLLDSGRLGCISLQRSHCTRDTASLGRDIADLLRRDQQGSLQIGGHWLRFDLKMDGLRLPKTRYA